jgi:hypothetical protein
MSLAIVYGPDFILHWSDYVMPRNHKAGDSSYFINKHLALSFTGNS